MPELHKNQIQWQAPEPVKVAFDKPDYTPLADAFNRLSNVADDLAQRKMKLLDDNLAADLKLAEDEANQIIEDEQSATADYGKLSEMVLSKVQGAFYKYDEATRQRFTQKNKNYFDEIQLAVSEKILQKTAKQIKTDVKVNLPLWASEAVVAGTPEARQAGVHKIQSTLKGLASPAEIEEFVYQYNNMIDKSNLNNLITAGTEESYAKARALINDPKHRPSIDPYEASVFNARIIAGEKDLAKAKAKADDPVSLALIQTYGIHSTTGATGAALELYRKVQSGGLVPYYTADKNGNPVVEYINTMNLTPAQRLGIITEMKKYNNLNPEFKRDMADYSSSVDEAMVIYAKAVDTMDSDQDEGLQLLIEYENSPLFDFLEDGTQKKIAGMINEQMKSRVEASLGEAQETGVLGIASKAVGNPVTELSRMLIQNKWRPAPEGGITSWLMRSPANHIEDKYSPYANNITNALIGSANIWKDRFAKDMERNTISEYGLYHKVLLAAYRDAGMLDGTRFAVSNKSIEQAFSRWSFGLKRDMAYNDKISDKNEKRVEDFYQLLVSGAVGEKSELNPREKYIINEMSKIVRTGQANRDFSGLRQYMSTPDLKANVKPVSGSNYKKNYQVMQAMNVVNTSSRTEKAAEKLK